MNVNDSPFHRAVQRFKQNRPALAGVVFIAFLILVSLGGASIRPDSSRDANNQHLSIARQKPGFTVDILHLPDGTEMPITNFHSEGEQIVVQPFGEQESRAISADVDAVSVEHRTYLLGTDKYGRDLLSRLMAGTGLSLAVGFIAVLISLLLGVALGACAGYFGGKTDAIISWVINVVWSIPTLLMVIAITLAFGKGFWQVFVAVGLTMWVEVARVVRGQFLSIREKEYIEAARMLGLSNFRIMFSHILPNASGPIIVISAANFASAILIEAGLSFLGIGAQIPTPSWGNMIKEHYALITTDLAYLAILPGILIMLLVLSFMMIGNGLRDAMDVRS